MNAASTAVAEGLLTARIESVAAGGAGVARHEGRVVFIPRTAPGDAVRFRIRADKGRYLLGELDAVEEPGPARREPPCPHWAACGGCPLQQMLPEAQAQAKRRILLDALARIGKMDLPVPLQTLAPESPEFGYRLRARFQIRGEAVGFFEPGTRRLAPIEACLLVERPIAEALREVRRLLRLEPAARRVEAAEITSLGPAPEEGAGLLLHPCGARERGRAAPDRQTRTIWEGFGRGSGFPLSFAGDRGPGDPPAWTARYEAGEGLTLRVSPESFIQPSRAGNLALLRTLLEEAGLGPGGRAVDLFCGAGNFALPLARRGARVVGVESNPFAARDAEANRRETGVEGARFLHGEAERLDAGEIARALGGPPDVLILDPPRKGALAAIPILRALAPRRVLYVSCNPATLARDARAIRAEGYRIERAFLIPMFPNTAHVETLTSWSRGENPPPEDGKEDVQCS